MPRTTLLVVAGAVLIIVGYFVYVRTVSPPSYQLARVIRGSVVQEALASGNVVSPTSSNMHFKGSGTLAALTVHVGQTVEAGQVLAKQNETALAAQLAQAQAARDAQNAQLVSLQEGMRPEAIAVTEAQVAGDREALVQSKQGVVNAVQNAYVQSDDAIHNKVDQFFDNPRSATPSLVFSVSDSSLESSAEGGRPSVEQLLATWLQTLPMLHTADDPLPMAAEAQTYLTTILSYLTEVNAALNAAIPSTSASQTSVNGWIANTATARANVSAASTALTTAIAAEHSASATLSKDERNLVLQQSGPTESAVAAQKAEVEQAAATVANVAAQLHDLELVAPFGGVVTDTNGTVGEIVGPDTVVVSLIPHDVLQVQVNVSEDTVIDVKVGQPVRIELDAYPVGTTFDGVVSEIDPAATYIGGAVYYKTTVLFNAPVEGLRSGMTANVWIQTGSASSTLSVPASALRDDDKGTYVDVYEKGSLVRVGVSVGLKGADGSVEIRSGLSEGQQVVLGP